MPKQVAGDAGEFAVNQVADVIMELNGVDQTTAATMASQLVNAALSKLDDAEEVPDDAVELGYTLVSVALYDLSEQELEAL